MAKNNKGKSGKSNGKANAGLELERPPLTFAEIHALVEQAGVDDSADKAPLVTIRDEHLARLPGQGYARVHRGIVPGTEEGPTPEVYVGWELLGRYAGQSHAQGDKYKRAINILIPKRARI